jgi:DMSO/TMAO reductase YedYZ molybdopterin-dependent catalytic subunit
MNSDKSRLPPGQRLVSDEQFPVLDLGVQPEISPENFKLEISGLVENPVSLSFTHLQSLPPTDITADFHCVTRWSKFDVKWSGVAWKDIEALVKPKLEARFISQYGSDSYSTNVPLEDMRQENVIVAYSLYGEPIPKEHGGPVRIIVPHLYAWKGSKFLKRIEFLAEDRPGFWEVRGYHNHGDPWTEERYG